MELTPGAIDRVLAKYRDADQDVRELVERVAAELRAAAEQEAPAAPASAPSPFAISWMDSYLAHWELRQEMRLSKGATDSVRHLVRELIDVRFNERLAEIRDVIAGHGARAPDGGPPEPGTPPVGPTGAIFEAPDGGPPEPGTPPAGPTGLVVEPDGGPPDGGPPEPGPPEPGPPEPGPPEPVPPVGPDGIFSLEDNPWILYWFVSVKAPMLLDMSDAHLVRRLDELRGGQA